MWVHVRVYHQYRVCYLQKEALMEQVAHQAVVMQFILEMASNSKQDPRGCFRHFIQKARVSHRLPYWDTHGGETLLA